ncbi:hypothetical protein B0T14DRAFT_528168 [Immersiella caudata]|uniref:Protection of telomeres protein 1 n=1 Tax=Immersiella caudata TaxID=314043 RepID=A0AA39WF84_9PEZI|nr:hypothetical protein B0T14DRAFT_528168 [Immersiella caudata]
MAPSSLPPDFVEIRDIDGDKMGKFVNVVGIVKDCRLPIPTAGKDFKCTLRIFDASTDGSGEGIDMVIFRPEAEMPEFGARDVVVLHKAKVQRYRSDAIVSLISHHTTKFSVFKAGSIPKPPNSAKPALVQGHKRDSLQPSEAVNRYVSYLLHKTDAYDVPDEAEFQEKAAASRNINTTKFRLLKDVSDGIFCDIIAEVARKPFDGGDKMTLYVSDYTENNYFFHSTWEGIQDIVSKAASDPYGYTRATQDDSGKEKDEWVGPYGKNAIQITCWEPHASLVRSDVSAGDWVRIRNLCIKYGKDDQNLEGVLRGDQRYPDKLNIEVMGNSDPENADDRLKEAMRRRRDYHREKKRQMKEQVNQLQAAQAAGQKRKQSLGADQEPEKKTRNQKKKERNRRKALGQQRAQQEQDETPGASEGGEYLELPGDLNKSITCESHPGTHISTIGSILRSSHRGFEETGQKLTLPFVCAKYRACVRVVNFHPSSLEKFACSHEATRYEGFISDEESDSEGGTSDDSMDEGDGRRVWEWRFALQLEDARHPGQRVWTVVDNFNAQCLTGLDASDLRHDRRKLEQLRSRMFLLWGNLEEAKSEAAEARKKPVAKKQSVPQLERPPLDSSDREDNGVSSSWESSVSNLPFICCIQQYGVCVTRASSPTDDTAPKQEWTRVFGLLGTKISH